MNICLLLTINYLFFPPKRIVLWSYELETKGRDDLFDDIATIAEPPPRHLMRA